MNDKTEDPTSARLEKLRKKGDVAKSRELNRSAALLGASFMLLVRLPAMTKDLMRFLRHVLSINRPAPLEGVFLAIELLLIHVLPIIVLATIVAFFSGAIQTKFLFVPKQVLPKLKRLDPEQIWTQRFRKEAIFNALIVSVTSFLGIFVGILGLKRITKMAPELAMLSFQRDSILSIISILFKPLVITIAAWVGIAFGMSILDAFWQNRAHLDRNKMSLKEIKDEFKHSEGDPEIAFQQEMTHRTLLENDLESSIIKADFVLIARIKNEKVAIGICYRKEENEVPIVVANRPLTDSLLVESHQRKIPIIYNDPVVYRLLSKNIGEEVPEGTLESLAVIYRWLRQ